MPLMRYFTRADVTMRRRRVLRQRARDARHAPVRAQQRAARAMPAFMSAEW